MKPPHSCPSREGHLAAAHLDVDVVGAARLDRSGLGEQRRLAADHPCSADLYRGEFTVRDEDRWRTVWRVRGPAKDLELDTGYVRAG
ncbi:hypothetical protein GCM10027073_19350 [Streptomyces chlorus]